MKRITFNIPTVNGTETREGFVIRLSVGPWTRRFVLQSEGSGFVLADFASGFKLCDLRPRMLRRFVGHPAAHDRSVNGWRAEAQCWLLEVTDKKGLCDVQAKLNSVPVINGVSK